MSYKNTKNELFSLFLSLPLKLSDNMLAVITYWISDNMLAVITYWISDNMLACFATNHSGRSNMAG